MFDPAVQIEIRKVERVLSVVLVKHTSAMVRHIEAERRCKVERFSNRMVHLLERDVFAVVR